MLNLFAGQIFFRSFEEYTNLCDLLGIAYRPTESVVHTDGFIARGTGKWGLKNSPVKFLRVLMSTVRKDSESIARTDMGKLLDGEILEEDRAFL